MLKDIQSWKDQPFLRMMTPLGTIFRPGSNKPKIDQHSLFTSIQVSAAILEGDLQIYEPWRRKRSRPKECHVTLYANETSPFLVWHKIGKGRNLQHVGNHSSSECPVPPRPRCVISVSRAKLTKTAGGSFEMTDFGSNLTFRFIAKTIREAELWVKKLAEESLRETKLDMRSLCSSCSSSTSSFPSPVATPSDPNGRFFSASASTKRSAIKLHRKSASFSDAAGAIMQLLEKDEMKKQAESAAQSSNGHDSTRFPSLIEPENIFAARSTASHVAASDLDHMRSSSRTFPRTQTSRAIAARRQQQKQQQQQQQHHIRAQPHLGLSVLDKHRPDVREAMSNFPLQDKDIETTTNSSELPFSEYFVNVPNA